MNCIKVASISQIIIFGKNVQKMYFFTTPLSLKD